MCKAVLIETLSETPHPGSYTRALLVSQDRRHLFVTPCYESIRIRIRNPYSPTGQLGTIRQRGCLLPSEAIVTWEKDTQELTIIHRYGEERGSLVRGGGRNWGKPDKKDIKKEETKQKKQWVKGNSKPNQIPDNTVRYLSFHWSTFQKSFPTHNGNGTPH